MPSVLEFSSKLTGEAVTVRAGCGGMVNTVLLLAEPPALDTRINPVAAPAGTVTVIWVRAAFTVAPGAGVP